jgi:sensor histidine kinase YesM
LSDSLFFQTYPKLFPVVPVLLLVINVLIYVLSDRVMYMHSEQNQRRLLEQQNTYYVNQYLMTRDRQEEAFKFQHDFTNILLGLRARLAAGDEDSSARELDRLLGAIGPSAGSCNTGNLVIDSMINYKEQLAAEHNIPFRLEPVIPPDLQLDTTVISVILGNALDNAIEAGRACPENSGLERYVAIHMHYLNDSLFLRIRNPYYHEIRTGTYGKIRSTKSGTRAHGIGLQNIRQTIEECGGLLDITYDSGIFQVEIVLFNIQRQHTA